MKTRYFCFTDMETSFALAHAEGLTHEEPTGNTLTDAEGNEYPEMEPRLTAVTHEYALDVIGTIHQPTGNMLTDEGGNQYPEMAPIPGWHVNARILSVDPLPASFATYEVFPDHPVRDFA